MKPFFARASNYKSALEKITPFAKSGNWVAQVIMADMYAYGMGVPVDEVRAAIWFRSAECLAPKPTVGSFPGSREYVVGTSYLTGDPPVESPNKALALRWIVRAAEAGHPDAQKLLSDDGMQRAKGLTPDPALTEYWRRFISESQR